MESCNLLTPAAAAHCLLLVPVGQSDSVFEWQGVAPSVAAQWTVRPLLAINDGQQQPL